MWTQKIRVLCKRTITVNIEVLIWLGRGTQPPIHSGNMHSFFTAKVKQLVTNWGLLSCHRYCFCGLQLIWINSTGFLRQPRVLLQVTRRWCICFIKRALIGDRPVSQDHFLQITLLMILFLKLFQRAVTLLFFDSFQIGFLDIPQVLNCPLIEVLHLGEFEVYTTLHGTSFLWQEALLFCQTSLFFI